MFAWIKFLLLGYCYETITHIWALLSRPTDYHVPSLTVKLTTGVELTDNRTV